MKTLIFTFFLFLSFHNFGKTHKLAPTKKLKGQQGNVTGGSCKSDADCGTCGLKKGIGAPGGLVCMCLPSFNKCGFGHPDWARKP